MADLFVMTPNDPDNGGTQFYGFGTKRTDTAGASTWELSHLATGNYDGTGCPLLRINTDDVVPSSDLQFTLGWQGLNLGHSWTQGDSMYVCVRVYYEPESRLAGESGTGNKWIDIGSAGQSRFIIWQKGHHTTAGQTLNFQYYGTEFGGAAPDVEYLDPVDFGLANQNWATVAPAGQYWGHHPTIGVAALGTPASLATYSGNATPGVPQINSAAASDGWYHLQFQIISGTSGNVGFRMWANNNTQASPSSEMLNIAAALDVTNWNTAITVGGFWNTDANDGNSFAFRIGGFKIATHFTTDWYPGEAPEPPAVSGSAHPGLLAVL